MDIEKILVLFSRLSGLSDEKALTYRCLCESAAGYVLGRLAEGTDPAQCIDEAEFAAAALANYRYALASLTEGNAGEIKVGDISVKTSGLEAVKAAEKLCREAFESLRGLLRDDGFVFKGV